MTELASMGGDTAADSHTTATGKTRATEPYELADVPGPLSGAEPRAAECLVASSQLALSRKDRATSDAGKQ